MGRTKCPEEDTFGKSESVNDFREAGILWGERVSANGVACKESVVVRYATDRSLHRSKTVDHTKPGIIHDQDGALAGVYPHALISEFETKTR